MAVGPSAEAGFVECGDSVAIVVEKDRLLIGGDPTGIYEFERLDKK